MSRALVLILVVGCAAVPSPSPSSGAPQADAPVRPPELKGLGDRSRPVSGTTPEGQRWFDQGLSLVYGFNHDEAIKAFTYATLVSPGCAMCFWGFAYALGPHINNTTVPPANGVAAVAAAARAQALAGAASPVEQALIAALATRYADPPPADRAPLERAYAEAMRQVRARFPGDPDVAALTAEALMTVHPWDLYGSDGSPREWTPEIIDVTEAALALDRRHPLSNHVYIHAVEASTTPERGAAAADVLRTLQPGLGHMVHMPSHIDVRTGRWDEAIEANRMAIAADDAYRAIVPRQGFYTIYMIHNRQMLSYAAMMSGKGALAISTMGEATAAIPPAFLEEAAPLVDGYVAMPLEVLMRFGKWDELLAVPQYPAGLPASRALRSAARGIAHAAKGELAAAAAEQEAFLAARRLVPPEWKMGNNPMAAVLDVAEHLLAGELLYRQRTDPAGQEQAFAELRKAVAAEDALVYNEPPDWVQPTRHALGAALISSRRYAEAAAVFREDLRRTPGNGWGLFGLAQALTLGGERSARAEAAALSARFERVWAGSDTPLHAACLCMPGP